MATLVILLEKDLEPYLKHNILTLNSISCSLITLLLPLSLNLKAESLFDSSPKSLMNLIVEL